MNDMTSTTRSRRFARLTASLAGLALLGAGIGAAQAHDFEHHPRSRMHVRRHLPVQRDHDRYQHHARRDYGHHRHDYSEHYGWGGDRYDYHEHRYARDGWHHHDHDRGMFGRW